jgi:hypothetical protein
MQSYHRFPGQSEFRPAVQQQSRFAGPAPDDTEGRAIGAGREVLFLSIGFVASILPEIFDPRLVSPLVLA